MTVTILQSPVSFDDTEKGSGTDSGCRVRSPGHIELKREADKETADVPMVPVTVKSAKGVRTEDDVAKRRMTPFQESLNAVTMIIPSSAGATYLYLHPQASICAWICFISTAVHCPFSMIYHLQLAWYQTNVHPVDNLLRVLDQSFILITGACFAFALSGNFWYGAAVAVSVAVWLVWLFQDFFDVRAGRAADARRGGIPGRLILTVLVVVLYIGPIFVRGDLRSGFGAAGIFSVCSVLFSAYPLGRYSHAAFHLLLGPYQWVLIQSAGATPLKTSAPESGLVGLLVIGVVVRYAALEVFRQKGKI